MTNNTKQFFRKKISKKIWIPNDDNILKINKTINKTWFNSDFNKCNVTNENILSNNDIKNINEIETDLNIKPLLRSRKIEIFFKHKDRQIINEWIELYNHVYNFTLRYYRLNKKEKKSFYYIRSKIKPLFHDEIKDRIKKSKIPSHTIDNAISDVIKAYKSCFGLLRAGQIKHFTIRYKRKTSLRQSIVLEASCFSKKSQNTFCSSVFGSYIKTSESIEDIKNDCRLSFHRGTDKYFLFVPSVVDKNISLESDIAILDPGKRTFQTCLSSNDVIDYGNDVSIRVEKELKKCDHYKYLYKITKYKKYKKIYQRTENHLHNLVNELHHKVSNDLCNRYKCILIGRLSTKNTNRKDKSCLTKMTKRILQYLSHYKFRNVLQAKCEQKNIKMFSVDEKYTSKTCSICGGYNKKLGGNKIYNCNKCKTTIDRDHNGCRNIFIKNYNGVVNYLSTNE